MANIKSAKKRIGVTLKKRQNNVVIKTKMRSAIKKFESAIAEISLDSAKEELKKASKLIDKAVTKGVVHKNMAARKKSRLAQSLNKLLKEKA